jgi:hypothetical protein
MPASSALRAGPDALARAETTTPLFAGPLVPAFLDDDQAAAYLGLTAQQLCLYRKRGDGPVFVQMGVRARYPLRELAEWAAAQPRFRSRREALAADPGRADAAVRQGRRSRPPNSSKPAKRLKAAGDSAS